MCSDRHLRSIWSVPCNIHKAIKSIRKYVTITVTLCCVGLLSQKEHRGSL